MGNSGSSGSNNRRRHGGGGTGRRVHPPVTPPPPPPEIAPNRFAYPTATTQYHNYPGYYPPPPTTVPMPLPAPYDHHHRPPMDPMWGRYPPPPLPPAPYVEHQKAVTIKNDVNIKKETLKIEPDEENPGHFLVSFTFDATVSGRVQFPLTIWGSLIDKQSELLLKIVSMRDYLHLIIIAHRHYLVCV